MNILNFLAVTDKINAGEVGIPTQDANAVLSGGLNTIYVAAGIVAVVAIVLAGYRFVVSGGDAAAVAKSKNVILYAVVGLVVIFLAFAVTWYVIGRF